MVLINVRRRDRWANATACNFSPSMRVASRFSVKTSGLAACRKLTNSFSWSCHASFAPTSRKLGWAFLEALPAVYTVWRLNPVPPAFFSVSAFPCHLVPCMFRFVAAGAYPFVTSLPAVTFKAEITLMPSNSDRVWQSDNADDVATSYRCGKSGLLSTVYPPRQLLWPWLISLGRDQYFVFVLNGVHNLQVWHQHFFPQKLHQ